MKLVITIDTEEDDWGGYKTTGATLRNIERIPRLQELFDKFGVRPTYLITYPVATDQKSIRILKDINDSGRCEIGTHCHPWNTPPFKEKLNDHNSMLSNLPSDLQYEKLRILHDTISDIFGEAPTSFRAGRWGFNSEVAINILKLRYSVDTSISPFINWKSEHGPDFSMAPVRAYKCGVDNILKPNVSGVLTEVPATIGFLQSNFNLCVRIFRTTEHRAAKALHLRGLLSRIGVLNRLWFSPEYAGSSMLCQLASNILQNNFSIINLTFHSSSLLAGITPFVRTSSDEQSFFENINSLLEFLLAKGVQSITLSQTPEVV